MRRAFPIGAGLLFLLIGLALVVDANTRWVFRQQCQMLALGDTRPLELMKSLGLKEMTPRQQWAVDASGPGFTAPPLSLDECQRRWPSDYTLALGAATLTSREQWSAPTRALNELARLNPDRPSALAAALNRQFGGVGLRRRELDLMGMGSIASGPPRDEPADPTRVDEMLRFAAAGERLEPDNAFFVQARAYALFAARRDAEALQAILQAAEKPRWDDYSSDAIVAADRYNRIARGDPSALSLAGSVYGALYSDLAGLRRLSLMGAYHAGLLEKAGKVDEGLTLRMALLRQGARVRADARAAPVSMMGTRIIDASMAAPGGDLLGTRAMSGPPPGMFGSAPARRPRASATLPAYLARVGRADRMRAFAAELAASAQARGVLTRLAGAGLTAVPFARLGLLWCAGVALLAGAVWLLAVAALAAVVRRAEPPRRAVSAAGVAIALLLLGALWARGSIPCLIGDAQSGLLNGLGAASGPAVGAIVTAALAAVTLALLALPILATLTVAVAAVAAFLRGRGMSEVLPRLCAGLALLLFVGYAVVAWRTAAQERIVRAELLAMARNEPQYLARQAGVAWPGVN